MFSLSHPEDGTFRLELHASPSDLSRREARRLRAILLRLAQELDVAGEDGLEEAPEAPGAGRTLPARRRAAPQQREAS